jgi:signal peptidase I
MTNSEWRNNRGGRLLIVLAWIGGSFIVALLLARISPLLGGPGYAMYNIPAGSMFPSVQVGDHIVALANVYRDQVPPRGQIVVFKFPPDGKTDYIKRVVGLPGDRIQLRAGLLFINDRLVPREAAPDPVGEDASGRRLHIYRETLPDGVTHLIAEAGDDEMLDNTAVFTVPAGHVFMLGDNRDYSADSRISDSVGYVPLALLRDKPLFVMWSTNTSRIGTEID